MINLPFKTWASPPSLHHDLLILHLTPADRCLDVDRLGGNPHDVTRGCDVGSPRREDVYLGVLGEALLRLEPLLGGGRAAHLTHAVHLVAHHLAPVGAVLVGLDDSRLARVLVKEDQSVTAPAVINDGNLYRSRCQGGDKM